MATNVSSIIVLKYSEDMSRKLKSFLKVAPSCFVLRDAGSPRRPLLRGRLRLRLARARGAAAEPADVARGAVARRRARAHHLREQLDVVVGLARHLFADGVQLFEESRLAVHRASIVNRKAVSRKP